MTAVHRSLLSLLLQFHDSLLVAHSGTVSDDVRGVASESAVVVLLLVLDHAVFCVSVLLLTTHPLNLVLPLVLDQLRLLMVDDLLLLKEPIVLLLRQHQSVI